MEDLQALSQLFLICYSTYGRQQNPISARTRPPSGG